MSNHERFQIALALFGLCIAAVLVYAVVVALNAPAPHGEIGNAMTVVLTSPTP